MLHGCPGVTEFFHDMLDFIEKKLLRMNPNARAKCSDIVKEFAAMRQRCQENEGYCTTPNPTQFTGDVRTPTDLSELSANRQILSEAAAASTTTVSGFNFGQDAPNSPPTSRTSSWWREPARQGSKDSQANGHGPESLMKRVSWADSDGNSPPSTPAANLKQPKSLSSFPQMRSITETSNQGNQGNPANPSYQLNATDCADQFELQEVNRGAGQSGDQKPEGSNPQPQTQSQDPGPFAASSQVANDAHSGRPTEIPHRISGQGQIPRDNNHPSAPQEAPVPTDQRPAASSEPEPGLSSAFKQFLRALSRAVKRFLKGLRRETFNTVVMSPTA